MAAVAGRSPTFSGLLRMEASRSPGGSPGGAARRPSPFGESATRPTRAATTTTAGYSSGHVSDAGDPPLAEPRLAPLGDEGWAVPPSYDDAGAVANVRGADWERRMQSRERALAQSEAELRRAEERADAERARLEQKLERREAEAAEATAKCAEMSLKAEAAAESERRAKAALDELKTRVNRERAELQADVSRRERAVDAKERELARDEDERRARADRDAAETRAKALAELRDTKKLVSDSQRELERLASARAAL